MTLQQKYFSEWITLNYIFHRSFNRNKNALTLSVFHYLQDFEVVEALEHGARDVSQVIARKSPVEGQNKCFGSFAVRHIDDYNREKRIWWIHKDEYACVCIKELMVETKVRDLLGCKNHSSWGSDLFGRWSFTEISLLYGLQTHQHFLKEEPRYECALSSFCLPWQQTSHSTTEFTMVRVATKVENVLYGILLDLGICICVYVYTKMQNCVA